MLPGRPGNRFQEFSRFFEDSDKSNLFEGSGPTKVVTDRYATYSNGKITFLSWVQRLTDNLLYISPPGSTREAKTDFGI